MNISAHLHAHPSRTIWTVLLGAALLAGCEEKPASEGAGSAKATDSGKTSDAKPDAKSAGATAPASAKIASCNLIKAESICREYGEANVSAAGEDTLKSTCDTLEGAFKLEACPKDKRVGSCVTQEGTKIFYSEGAFPLEASAAEKQCKEGVPAWEWKAGA